MTSSPTTRATTAVVALVVLGALCACAGSSGSSDELKGLVRTPPLDVSAVTLPDVTTGAPAGSTFTMRADPGTVLVAYFGYTSCPDVCPTTLADIRTARRSLGADAARVSLAMVTVDPGRDTPDVLNPYVSSFVDRYRALRTDDAAALRAAEAPFLASSSVTGTGASSEVTHTGTIYAVDSTGHVAVEWAFGTSSDTIAHDLRRVLQMSTAPTTEVPS